MKGSFRQSMAWLHTWIGLLPGWVCFAIFLFGTAAFFKQEISQWMRPEVRAAAVSTRSLDSASALLERRAAGAIKWTLSLPESRGGDRFDVAWIVRSGDTTLRQRVTLDPQTGHELTVRDTRGGDFLYRFHYDLHYLRFGRLSLGRLLVCIASLAMLVAILSGLVTHKKIFADFFLLRFGKGQRSWLDAHNVTAVLALPFHLMITYTGLVTLLFTLMPWAISANFSSEDAFDAAASQRALRIEASGIAAPSFSVSKLVAHATALREGVAPRYIEVLNPGDTNAIASLWPSDEGIPGPRGALYVSAVTGEALQVPPVRESASITKDVMVDIHAGRFAKPILRWLYFLSGVGGTVMIASGLVLWIVKRRAKLPDPRHPHFGFHLVERLNIGFIAGAPAGIAVYFLANRLLPVDLAYRAAWEINSLFIAWGGVFVWSLARSSKRAWIEALTACAVLYALVPVVNALTTPRGLIPSLIARDWVFAGFDLTMLATSAAAAAMVWKVAAHKSNAVPRRKARELAEAGA